MNTVLCPHCSTPNDSQARFCIKCGKPLSVSPPPAAEQEPLCPRCHVPVRTSARFCPSCGYDLLQQPVPAAKPVPAVKPTPAKPAAAKTGQDTCRDSNQPIWRCTTTRRPRRWTASCQSGPNGAAAWTTSCQPHTDVKRHDRYYRPGSALDGWQYPKLSHF